MPSTAGIRAGKAFVEIGAVDKTARVLKKISGRLKNWGSRIQSLGRTMMKGTIIAATPAAIGLATFMKFDDALRKVEARSSGSAKEMEALRQQAKDLGRETRFTASEVGELQAKIAQKGFNRSKIKDMTKDVLNLASAAGEGTEQDTTLAADLVSGTLRAYKMEATEAGRVSDVFSAAVNNSNATLQSLIDGMKSAAPVASQYGLGLEETVAILGTMTNVNIEASSAGVAMRNMFLNTSNKTLRNSFNKQLEAATGKTVQFVDAAGNLRKMPDILMDITKAMEGMGSAEAGDLLTTLFGKRAVVPAMASQDQKGFSELLDVIQKSEGAAERTAKTMEGGPGGAWRSFKSAVEAVFIEIGEGIDKVFTPFLRAVTENVRAIAKWIGENQRLIGSIAIGIAIFGAVSGAIMGVGIAFTLAGIAMSGLAAVLPIITGMFGIMLSPIGAVIGIVGLLTAAWLKWTTSGQQAMSTFSRTFQQLKAQFMASFGAILEALKRGDIKAALDVVMAQLQLVWLQGTSVLTNIWEKFTTRIAKIWVDTLTGVKQMWGKVATDLASVVDRIAKASGMELISRKRFDELHEEGGKALAVLQDPNATAEQKKEAEATRQRVKNELRGKRFSMAGEVEALVGSQEDIRKEGQQAVNILNQEFQRGLQERRKAIEAAKMRLGLARLVANNPMAEEGQDDDRRPKNPSQGTQPMRPPPAPTPGRTPLGTAIQGLEKGTAEAVQKAAENAQAADRTLEELQKQTGVLEDISENTGQLEGV